MSRATLIIIVAVFATTLNRASSQPVAPSFRYKYCRTFEFGTYSANSAYEASLTTVLADLELHASEDMFHNSSAGAVATATVHGQYYCRGDVSPDFCSQCIQAAALTALNCSNAKAAIVWYNECTLRYMNQSMYGVPENDLVLDAYNTVLNVTDPGEFSGVLKLTVTGLIQEAVQGSGFAAKDALVSGSPAYFLVGCSSDLTGSQCQSCLDTAFNETQTCCGQWPVLVYNLAPSCQVMYNTVRRFYFTSSDVSTPPDAPTAGSATPPPTPPNSEPSPPGQVTILPTPPSSIANKTQNGGTASTRSTETFKLTIVTVAVLVMLSVLH